MVKVEKSKYIRICLMLLAAAALIFLTTLTYFLGWEFDISTFWIYLAIIAAEIIAFVILCFALIKANKSYYLVTAESIKLFKGNKEILAIPSINVVKIHYIGFAWILLMQMGAGYLHIEYTEGTGQIKPTVSFPNGKKIYAISMSPKQAKQVSEILNKNLQQR